MCLFIIRKHPARMTTMMCCSDVADCIIAANMLLDAGGARIAARHRRRGGQSTFVRYLYVLYMMSSITIYATQQPQKRWRFAWHYTVKRLVQTTLEMMRNGWGLTCAILGYLFSCGHSIECFITLILNVSIFFISIKPKHCPVAVLNSVRSNHEFYAVSH